MLHIKTNRRMLCSSQAPGKCTITVIYWGVCACYSWIEVKCNQGKMTNFSGQKFMPPVAFSTCSVRFLLFYFFSCRSKSKFVVHILFPAFWSTAEPGNLCEVLTWNSMVWIHASLTWTRSSLGRTEKHISLKVHSIGDIMKKRANSMLDTPDSSKPAGLTFLIT